MPDDIAGIVLPRLLLPSADNLEPGTRRPLLGQLENGAVGTRGGDGSMAVRGRERAGCFLYGPYLHLAQGRYRLHFRCRSGRPRLADQPVLGVEIIVLSRFQQQWRDFTANELAADGGKGALDFEVPPEHSRESENEGRFEFRFFHLGNADLAVEAVDLECLQPEGITALPPRRWRLLGRLQKSWLGRRGGDGTVRVARLEPVGRVLYGAWPYLRLPRGRYRLMLAVRSGLPLSPDRAVLGIEILGQSRWRSQRRLMGLARLPETNGTLLAWRDATATEIASNAIAVDFIVPTDIALEAGADAPVDIRVHHFGNAGFVIDAVDLTEMRGVDGAMPAPLSRWRLLGRLREARFAERRAGVVTVRGDQPPGQLLSGLLGALRLPAGPHRLSLRGTPDRTVSPLTPLLAMEITARPPLGTGSLWSQRPLTIAQRTITASELTAGTPSMAFEVPPALAIGAGNWRFAVAVHHLGRGAVSIGALDLSQISTQQQAAAVTAPRLRPAGRRKIVIIGNCQSETLRQGFAHIDVLNQRFEAKYHFIQLPKNLHEFAARDLETCDFLLIQDIRLWDEFPLRDCVRPGAESARYPLVRFGSPWPFDAWNGPGDKEAHDREAPNLTFPYLDGLLGRMRREIPDPEARFRAYRALDMPGVVNYRRLHEMEVRRLAAVDRKYDCSIGAFILENFQKRGVFHTTVRPNWEVFNLMMRLVARLVGVTETISLTQSVDASLRNPQVPIHPKVASDLGIGWADERTRYLSRGREITWEAYIRSYIAHYG
ncbi:MAG TPA: WcbI family polysaccharide biosynthesis putative acetyltransferase [Stellaceae bacterium]|jgi:hypothetical protein|nr:WcbI family polysaccharide biosynthesis putative acetyltransferase [Stellaceae bacterium]